jgi:hypothetical protein
LAATKKVAVWPTNIVWFAGCVVIEGATGAVVTVREAPMLVTLPAALLITTVN